MSINFLVSSSVILVFYESLEFHLNNMALKQQTLYHTYKKKVNIGKRHGHQSGGIMAQMMYYSKWAFIFFVTKVRRNWLIAYKFDPWKLQLLTLRILFSEEIEDITWPRGDTNFIFECWKCLSRVSEANEWEILSAREDRIRIPKRPCNVLFIL